MRVPAENVIGEVDRGLSRGARRRSSARGSAPRRRRSGIAQGATDYANEYAKERIAFGAPINRLQGIQFKLADMETKTAAARELLYKACAMADRNEPGLGKWTSMAKLFASDTAMEVTVEAVQVLGGYGYVNDYPVERMMRDAKITQIYEGTNEIQRVVIARAMSSVADAERPRRPQLARASPRHGRAHGDLPRDGRPDRSHDPRRGPVTFCSTTSARRAARSGRRPLLYTKDGDDLVIIASKGGNPKHPGWYHNLRANPDTEVQVGSERRMVHARVAEGDERRRMWNRAVAQYGGYAGYQKRTDREIPVVVLERRR